MKITKTTLLFIATLFFLAMPLAFVTSNASATVATVGTYNTDAAVHDATSGQWDLPSNFFCIAPPQVGGVEWDGSGAIPNATERDDLAAPSSSPVSPSSCTATSGAKTTIKTLTIAQCVSYGYAWSGYSGTCGASTWTTADPDNSPLPYYTDHKGCLRCHNDAYINAPGGRHAGDDWAVKTTYLYGGHKNMSRPVDGLPWGLPGTDASGIYANGTSWATHASAAYDWTNGTIGGTQMYWIFGGNGLEGTSPYSVVSGTSYSCGRCHTTGWTSDTAVNTDKEPEVSYPGVSSVVNLAGGVTGMSGTTASWDRWGIQCSRCHYATGSPTAASEPGTYSGGHTTFPEDGVSTGGDKTALCMGCHRQESGGIPLAIVNNVNPATIYADGTGNDFAHHSHANQFLNSPHARFTGTWAQIGCPPVGVSPATPSLATGTCTPNDMSGYDTHFKYHDDGHLATPAGQGGGCTECHDVHKTVIENVDTAYSGANATKACQDCHTYINLGVINHPNAPGTPLDDPNPCAVCHMPAGQHLFRINTDASYKTFPGVANATLNTSPDNGYDNAVWVDLDHSCGQCHGGSAGASATQNGAPYFTTDDLSTLAVNMHNTDPTAKFNWTNDSSTSYQINFNAISSACGAGTCTGFSWDFGDTSTGSGVATSHTYADATPKTVTLTVKTNAYTTDTISKVVTPVAVHQSFDCAGSLNPTVAQVGDTVTFTSTTALPPTNGGNAALYVNWGDGSALSVGAVTGSVTHSYANAGNYTVTQIVQDDLGFNCTKKFALPISKAGVNAGSGTLEIDTDATFAVSYYIKGLNDFNNLVTKASGSLASGGNVQVPIVPGDYQVYLYFANGHSCTWTQGQPATVTNGATTTVSATACIN